ncbi:MAG TPA: hypothetical protein VLU41_14260, partial [Ideonella sp.]|nr:hypothetical protein [Ideonella sp.]
KTPSKVAAPRIDARAAPIGFVPRQAAAPALHAWRPRAAARLALAQACAAYAFYSRSVRKER